MMRKLKFRGVFEDHNVSLGKMLRSHISIEFWDSKRSPDFVDEKYTWNIIC